MGLTRKNFPFLFFDQVPVNFGGLQLFGMICQAATMHPLNDNHWHQRKPPGPLAGWPKLRHWLAESFAVVVRLGIWAVIIGAVLRQFGLWFW